MKIESMFSCFIIFHYFIKLTEQCTSWFSDYW